MNDHLHPIREAVASFSPIGGVHFLAPEGNGHGPSSSARLRCTCGWIGPDRFEWQDDMCRLLEDDKTRHLRGEA